MNARRTALHIVLMLLLLCSQQMGLSHAVTHVLHSTGSPGEHAVHDAPAASHERPLPAELQCVKCLAFASIGSGLVDGAPHRAADPAAGPHRVHAAAARAIPSLIRAFDSRAPPASC